MSSKNKNRNYSNYNNENEENEMNSSSVESASSISSSSQVVSTTSVTSTYTAPVSSSSAQPKVLAQTPVTTVSAAKTGDVVSPDMAKLNAAVDKYIAAVEGKDKTAKSLVNLFYGIVQAVLSSQEIAVYNKFFEIYVKNYNTTMTNTNCLNGIHKITDANKKSTITSFYAIFFEIMRSRVNKTGFHLSFAAIRRAIRNEKFVNWLVSKVGKRG